MPPLTGRDIITKFELYKDDTSELSSVEELDLAQKIYNEIVIEREWEFLRKNYSGVTLSDGSVAIPSDFLGFMKNYSEDDTSFVPEKAVVFVGTDPYPVIPMGNRSFQGGLGNFFYADLSAGKIKSTAGLGAGVAISFDYKMRPPALTLLTSPVFPNEFHAMIYHGMAIDDDIIQIFEKARSYADVNKAKFDGYLSKLGTYNNKFLIP